MFAAWQGETLTAMYALLERYSEVIRALADELNFQLVSYNKHIFW